MTQHVSSKIYLFTLQRVVTTWPLELLHCAPPLPISLRDTESESGTTITVSQWTWNSMAPQSPAGMQHCLFVCLFWQTEPFPRAFTKPRHIVTLCRLSRTVTDAIGWNWACLVARPILIFWSSVPYESSPAQYTSTVQYCRLPMLYNSTVDCSSKIHRYSTVYLLCICVLFTTPRNGTDTRNTNPGRIKLLAHLPSVSVLEGLIILNYQVIGSGCPRV